MKREESYAIIEFCAQKCFVQGTVSVYPHSNAPVLVAIFIRFKTRTGTRWSGDNGKSTDSAGPVCFGAGPWGNERNMQESHHDNEHVEVRSGDQGQGQGQGWGLRPAVQPCRRASLRLRGRVEFGIPGCLRGENARGLVLRNHVTGGSHLTGEFA